MHIGFRLKPGRDDDLIRWVESLGNGDQSYYIRESLRRDLNAQKGGGNYALPPSPSPVIDNDKGKVKDVPKKAATKEFDIKRNAKSDDALEDAIKTFM